MRALPAFLSARYGSISLSRTSLYNGIVKIDKIYRCLKSLITRALSKACISSETFFRVTNCLAWYLFSPRMDSDRLVPDLCPGTSISL